MLPAATARRAFARFQAVPYSSEAAALLAIFLVIHAFPSGAPLSVHAVGVSGAAPVVLNGLGILLIYRANGFINFSQVALGTFAAVVFDGLVRGRPLLRGANAMCGCISRDPGGLARAVNFWLAAALALALAGAVGWLAYTILIRRFAQSPVLVLTIVTVFLAQALTGARSQVLGRLAPDEDIRKGLVDRTVEPPVDVTVNVGGFPLHLPQLALIVAALIATVGLWSYLRFSGSGVAMRASADNPNRARTLGVDVGAVNGRVWLVAGLLSGLAGVLGGFNGVGGGAAADVGTTIPIGELVVVLTIVVIARFTNIWLVALGGVALAVLQAAVQRSFSSQAPLDAALVFLVGGLLLIQRQRSTRAEREDFSGLEVTREVRPIPRELRSLPVVRKYVRLASVVSAGALLGLPWAISLAQTSLLTDSLIYVIVGLSLLVLTGWAGQVSLGQFGFAAIGAWAAASSGLPFALALPVAGLAGALAAVVVGLPALKLRGLHLAISTLAFSVSAHALFIDTRYFGRTLPESLDAPSIVGLRLDDERVYYYFILCFVVAACAVVVGLRRTRTGRVLIALRSNEAAGQSFGINPVRARLTAFSVSGFLAAIAGALLAYHLGRVAPEAFAADRSLVVFLYTVIGGLGGLLGPILGQLYYAVVTFFFADNPLVRYTANGTGALLLMYAAPGGLAQLVYAARDAMLRRVAYRLRIPVPSLMGEQRAGSTLDKVALEEKRAPARTAGELQPVRYQPAGQWALDRFGSADSSKERVGGRR